MTFSIILTDFNVKIPGLLLTGATTLAVLLLKLIAYNGYRNCSQSVFFFFNFKTFVLFLSYFNRVITVCVCVLNNSAVLVFFPTDETMVINVFCGVVSGVLSSSLANPTDVLKVTLSC